MKRLPAFDPPEYLSWQPDPALVRAFRQTIEQQPERAALVARLDGDGRRALYAGLVRTRLHDVTLKRWVRTGVISCQSFPRWKWPRNPGLGEGQRCSDATDDASM